MTTAQLREMFPTARFEFFKGGYATKPPFLHAKIKSWNVRKSSNTVFINL